MPKKKTAKPAAVKKRAAAPKIIATAAKPAPPKATPKTTGIYYYANGKRKTAVSMVRLHTNGKGEITINNRQFETYFPVFTDRDKVSSPLRATNNLKTFDVSVRVQGGGIHSQAESVRHGIAKALLAFDANLRSVLKPMGFISRDSRIKERKKYGLHRARRAPQFSKR